jgi:catechol 2,3-dioxygenase-like lactoylglutathione lyase family enzyme
MKLKNILIAVTDIERSKQFYQSLFGLDVVLDSDGNVILTEGLVLQDASIWKKETGQEVLFQNHASELYFEEADMDGFIKKLNNYSEPIHYVTQLTELPWGQKLVRIYDPDGNLIEIRTPS